MATLKSFLNHVTTTNFINATSAQNKIAEVIISNTTANENIEYQLFVTQSNKDYPITPKMRLLVGEVHTRPMSTFINSGDSLKITVTSGKTVDTITSIIEL